MIHGKSWYQVGCMCLEYVFRPLSLSQWVYITPAFDVMWSEEQHGHWQDSIGNTDPISVVVNEASALPVAVLRVDAPIDQSQYINAISGSIVDPARVYLRKRET